MTPAGHPEFASFAVPGARAVVRADVAQILFDIVSAGPVYAWAAAHPERRVMQGRLPVYAVPFSDFRVVVRHNHHGGLLHSIRGDRFIRPRARYEMAVSWQLTDAGVATPEVIGAVVYRVNWLEHRSDLITRELPPGHDLGALIAAGATAPSHCEAIAILLDRLGSQGGWHPDLNVKNIYLTDEIDPIAYVLDVDRVRFSTPYLTLRGNATRLAQSVRKVAAGRDVSALLAAIGDGR